jgi:nitrite reductase/ring-hydroxylating ferredoxin subunit
MSDQHITPAAAETTLPHVGTYRRVLPVSLERMYENALDWAHLPHVHASSFSAIECIDAGAWGWRAHVSTSAGTQLLLDLRLDRDCRRWITRSVQGTNAGAEIWTHAIAVGPLRTDVVIDFFVPGVAGAQRDTVGSAFAAIYRQLYDEDVAMMVERQRQLDRRIETRITDRSGLCLGARAALTVPLQFEFRGRAFHLVERAGELIAHVARCPHQLGPLPAAVDGQVSCPWHGYRFDVISGACLNAQPWRLAEPPVVSVRDGQVWVE